MCINYIKYIFSSTNNIYFLLVSREQRARKFVKPGRLNKLEILKSGGIFTALIGYVRFARSLTIPTSEPFSK